MTAKELAKFIDHSILHPTMTDADLEAGCQLAATYGTATVCIKPYAVPKAANLLEGTGVAICTVIGFPHGSNTTDLKVIETIEACRNGATEIDMVVNIGKVLEADWDYVEHEIDQIMHAALEHNAILKVIFENDYLEDSHKIKLCEICSKLHVAFVKTSTGYGFVKQPDGTFLTKGATLHDLRLMRAHCTPDIQIKAAGGIRNLKDMLAAIDAGATRIGATATAAIIGALNNDESDKGADNTENSSTDQGAY
jgi:deoxyribose-phosphate aldolase